MQGRRGRLPTRALDRRAAAALGVGLVLAVVATAVPVLRFVFSYLTVAIHEMGHAIFGWLFGYASIPAFDFRYGGGVTVHREQSAVILAGLYVLAAAAGVLHRRNRLALVVLAGGVAVHAVLAHSRAHQAVILFMGHGTEIVLAGVFLYRALSGSAILRGVERPLYAFCGLFILFCDVIFAVGLIANPLDRALYETAKGGGHWMDFSRVAERFCHVELATVAGFFLACCLIVPVCSFLAFRYQAHLRAGLRRLFRRSPPEQAP